MSGAAGVGGELRRPFLVAAVALVAVAFLVCLGSGLVTGPPPYAARVDSTLSNPQVTRMLADLGIDPADARAELDGAKPQDPPGLGIAYLALVDGLLLVVLLLTALPLVAGDRLVGSLQGVVSVVAGLIGLLTSVGLAFLAFAALLTMVSLLLAVPFGTLAYLAVFGSFDTGGAAVFTTLHMALLAAAAVCLLVAQQRFLTMKGLMALLGTAALVTFVTSLLQGLPPGILVSITDAVAAIVTAVVAAVWSLLVLVGGIVGAVRVLQVGSQGGGPALTRD